MSVRIADFLAPANIGIECRASDKINLLRELTVRAASALHLDAASVSNDIIRREQLGSTGVGLGVAIPHARVREIMKPSGVFVRLKSPIEFDSIDGRPVDLVFLLILPASPQFDQLNALAAVARRLRDKDVLRRLRGAMTATELYRIISE